MTFKQMKDRVALNLGNMSTTHPIYSEIAAGVNDAVRDLPKRVVAKSIRNIGLFPELVRRAKAVTVAESAAIDLPTESMLFPIKMYSFNSGTDPDDRDRSWPMKYVDPEVYEYLDKSSSVTGWPRIWTRIGSEAFIWPIPDATYKSYVRLHYIMKEVDMSADADTPTLDKQWHRAVTDLATGLVMVGMGDAKAQLFFAAADYKIGQTVNIQAEMENNVATHQFLSEDIFNVFGGWE